MKSKYEGGVKTQCRWMEDRRRAAESNTEGRMRRRRKSRANRVLYDPAFMMDRAPDTKG